jgi:hypothetical protein
MRWDRATMTVNWQVRIGVKASSGTAFRCSAAAVSDGSPCT